MNKLFIIGNGFDLAHGMNTKYSDFIEWLIQTSLKKGLDDFDKNAKGGSYQWEYKNLLKFEILKNKGELNRFCSYPINEIINSLKSNSDEINFTPRIEVKNKFVRNVIFKSFEKWVDIENEYFES